MGFPSREYLHWSPLDLWLDLAFELLHGTARSGSEMLSPRWEFLPAGGLALTGVANVRSCGPGRPGSAKVHIFLGCDFGLSFLNLLTVWLCGHWGCCAGRGGRVQRRRRGREWPRPELAPAALQLALCSSHTPLEYEMLLQWHLLKGRFRISVM